MNPLIAALLSSLRRDAKDNPSQALADINASLALVTTQPQALHVLIGTDVTPADVEALKTALHAERLAIA